MAKILFEIPVWRDSDPRLIRWTHVVENRKGECFIVDTTKKIANPKDLGCFETTVTPYDKKVAYDILAGKKYNHFEDPYEDDYAHRWSGCGKRTIDKLRRKRQFGNVTIAGIAHMEDICNL